VQLVSQIKEFPGSFRPAIEGSMQDCVEGVKAIGANDEKVERGSLRGSTYIAAVKDHSVSSQ